mmetsp:Transcript_1798/g.5992  ORF Transcript_1798/g.5992 Transcript_1798/m.5992 type:complete len:207 (-) Transcript_1798:686-1306(-)
MISSSDMLISSRFNIAGASGLSDLLESGWRCPLNAARFSAGMTPGLAGPRAECAQRVASNPLKRLLAESHEASSCSAGTASGGVSTLRLVSRDRVGPAATFNASRGTAAPTPERWLDRGAAVEDAAADTGGREGQAVDDAEVGGPATCDHRRSRIQPFVEGLDPLRASASPRRGNRGVTLGRGPARGSRAAPPSPSRRAMRSRLPL